MTSINKVKVLTILISIIIFSSFSFQVRAEGLFSDKECLDLSFEQKIHHRFGPFKMIRSAIQIKKNLCEISISYKRFYFFDESITFDVCREPVHFKKGFASSPLDIIKRSESEFVFHYQKILSIMEDDALIYAQGEKENINSEHGKLYCSFLLMKNYLGMGIVFSRFLDDLQKNKLIYAQHIDLMEKAKDISSQQKTEVKKSSGFISWFRDNEAASAKIKVNPSGPDGNSNGAPASSYGPNPATPQ